MPRRRGQKNPLRPQLPLPRVFHGEPSFLAPSSRPKRAGWICRLRLTRDDIQVRVQFHFELFDSA